MTGFSVTIRRAPLERCSPGSSTDSSHKSPVAFAWLVTSQNIEDDECNVIIARDGSRGSRATEKSDKID